ncbi:MAG: response regulator [Proteobacteria bacterium]|nr:response regulator [Pseudomonadota bacterium]
MKKSRNRYVYAIGITLSAWALWAGRNILASLSIIATFIIHLWRRSLENQVREQTLELHKQIEILKQKQTPSPDTPTIQETMSVCSQFAGGLAHDFNNILSGLITFPEIILMDLPENSPLVKPLNAILRSGLRASGLVSDLVAISKGISGDKTVMNVNMAVEHFLLSEPFTDIRVSFPKLHIETELDPRLLNIMSSSDHVETIVKNLIVQGYESTMGEGTLCIKTENRYLDTSPATMPDLPPGEYVLLSVLDNGLFIAPKDINHIFEPYYCKKMLERSCSGMGLAVVWNMVKNSNGFISVRSSEKGSVFDIYFPTCRDTLSLEKSAIQASRDLAGKGEHILVIDDDELQREIAGSILARAGYFAHAVPSGEEALIYLKENTADLIVLDMIMAPGISGYETYKRIIRIAPGQKAIIASGFVRPDEVDAVKDMGAGPYIRKPYTVEELLRAVKSELER